MLHQQRQRLQHFHTLRIQYLQRGKILVCVACAKVIDIARCKDCQSEPQFQLAILTAAG